MGMQVIAIDTGDSKRDLCLNMGASHFVDFMHPSSSSQVAQTTPMPGASHVVAEILGLTEGQGVHAALLFGGGATTYSDALAYLRRSGYLMAVGIPKGGPIALSILRIAGKSLTIRGISAA